MSALESNAHALFGGGGGIADLRYDAWGHGLSNVAPAVLAAGASGVLVDDGWGAVLTYEQGIDPIRVRTDHAPTRDSAALFGLADDFTPVMSLGGAVLGVKRLLLGEGVSYGYTFHAERDTRIALVTGGYAQGIVRTLGNAASVSRAGQRLPIIGRVAMDVCVIEIGDAHVERGDEVVFFGDPVHGEPALAEWAAATGLMVSELVVAVGLRAVREVVG